MYTGIVSGERSRRTAAERIQVQQCRWATCIFLRRAEIKEKNYSGQSNVDRARAPRTTRTAAERTCRGQKAKGGEIDVNYYYY